MSIISPVFFGFVAAALLLYYLVPLRWRWLVLLAASLFFFIEGCSIPLFLLMAGMCLLTYGGALGLDRLNQRQQTLTEEAPLKKLERQKKWLTIGVIVGLGLILAVLQDNAFFINNAKGISSLFGHSLNLTLPDWAVPLGISYYTLILIGYLLDVAWQTSPAQKNPLKLLLFTSYFPQMVSGPFTRYREMEGQLYTGHRFDHGQIALGAQRVLWGLFKKLVIAERLSLMVGTIYGDYEAYAGVYVFLGAIGYTLQVYADFSGCMDIIIGVSQMFGVTLPENFQTPFFSTSLSEVWRRWHMTLGFWVKDYLLYPVLKSGRMQRIGRSAKKKFGKKAGKRIPTYCGMFVTWFFVGFWHGGSWKYILGSGLFFFVMIVGGQLLEPLFQKLLAFLHINTKCMVWRWFQRVRTFLLFAFSVSFGRALSVPDAFAMWKNAFTVWNPQVLFDKSLYELGLDRQDCRVLLAALLLFFIVSLLQQKGSVRQWLGRKNIVLRWLVWFILIFSILLFGLFGPGYDASQFIYGGF